MSDDFDDLDDYLDDFDAEILSQEPGATIKKDGNYNNDNNNNNKAAISGIKNDSTDENNNSNVDTNAIINDMIAEDGLDPLFSKQLTGFMNMLDPNGNGSELDALLGSINSNESISGNGFQNTVNETINRLKNSSKQVDDESTRKMDNDEELLTTLLNSLDIGGDGNIEGFDELKDLLNGGEGEDGDGDVDGDGDGDGDVDKLTNVIMKMLNKLTSKEMMYNSVNTAVENYQEFFKDNKNHSETDDDLKRYVKQMQHLKNVKETFDNENYDEDDPETRDFIDQEMENFNKLLPPPPGVIQDNLADMGLDDVKWNDKEVPQDLEGCVQQ